MEDKKKFYTSLNTNNKYITLNDINKILLKGNISEDVFDIKIWQQSFIHKSYISKNSIMVYPVNKKVFPLQDKSNERLEWIGDTHIQSCVSYYLWNRYPDQNEGFLTKLRSKLVKTKNLAYLANKLNLSPFLILSHHVEFNCQGRTNNNILENTFEAFIGAMFEDFKNKYNKEKAYSIVYSFLITIIEKYVDIVQMVFVDENSKDQLMWYFQQKFNGEYPKYVEDKHENDIFYIVIYEPNTKKVVGRGKARSKKDAQQNAAKSALQYYSKKELS